MSEKDLEKEKTDNENTSENQSSETLEDIPVETTTKDELVAEESIVEEVASDEIESSDEPEKEDAEEVEIDYHNLSKQELLDAFKSIIQTKAVQNIKSEVEEIKTEFNAKFSDELDKNKEQFLADGGNIIDFHFSTPLKKEFNSLYFEYKEKKNSYYKNLKKDLHANFDKRQELIEELKGLLNAEESINSTYKHFKDIQERWFEAGAIPKDKYNTVWNTYHHHVENFYDFLHLNREFRDLDFKHNLEQKLKLIGRAEELAQEENINKSFRELQLLHKMWKEEIGPVAKEFRDEVWDKFSAATKIIHDKRQEVLKDLDEQFVVNYDVKKQLIDKIQEVYTGIKPIHKEWQNAIKDVQSIRDTFFDVGKVPSDKNKEIWNSFKEVTREFNKQKNAFYKDQKKEQFSNLAKKLELIKIADENKDGDDFEVITPLMKKIQSDWKKVGHVPRKDSDKIWKQFKEACNHYFNRVNAEKNEANKEEFANFTQKEVFLSGLSDLKLKGDRQEDLTMLKEQIKTWKTLGRVPYNKKKIEQQFNTTLDGLFNQLDLNKKEIELIRFENKLNAMVSNEDDRKLQNEEFFISKKVGEVKDEIRQLENNLGFFQHVDENNPMVKEVHNNIKRHKDDLEVWISKLSKMRKLRKG